MFLIYGLNISQMRIMRVLIIATLLIIPNVSCSDPAKPTEASQKNRISQEGGDKVDCAYNLEKPVVENPGELLNFSALATGPEKASITVIEFLDPNCPYSKELHPIILGFWVGDFGLGMGLTRTGFLNRKSCSGPCCRDFSGCWIR